MKNKRPPSLRIRLILTILLCWVLPILTVLNLAWIVLSNNYEESVRNELKTTAENSLKQLEIRLDAVFDASKSVSYDGVVRNSYRLYELNGDNGVLYRTVNEYLGQNFSRDDRIPASFISFWDVPEIHPYASNRSDYGYNVQKAYLDVVEADILDKMHSQDTEIFLAVYSGRLYLARNLFNSQLKPYATVVFQCDEAQLFQSIDAVRALVNVRLKIDDRILYDDGCLTEIQAADEAAAPELKFISQVDGHDLALEISVIPFDFWAEMPKLRQAVLAVILLVLPLLGVMIWFFHRLVARPVNTLVEAETRLEGGERGYQITESGGSREFQAIFDRFNIMSSELDHQFERSYQEQQALQQARIKALQSQINPHFLNNTLETINWEARLAGNEQVSAMIEALSVMLDAALDRNGRNLVPLRDELSYADAYLYIIRERLGERLVVERDIDETLLDTLIPRLILQPIIENAIEHDISSRRGGSLKITAQREAQEMLLSVEHDGVLTESDLERIRRLIENVSDESSEGHVGLKNVTERLRLMYGDSGILKIEQITAEKIRASIRFALPKQI